MIDGIINIVFGAVKFVFDIFFFMFRFAYEKIKFLIDICKEDAKFEKHLKKMKYINKRNIKLNDEI